MPHGSEKMTSEGTYIRKSGECSFSVESWYCCCLMMSRQCPRTCNHTKTYETQFYEHTERPRLLVKHYNYMLWVIFTFLVSWGRMTPSSQRRPEEKKAELSSSSFTFKSPSCSLSGGSREPEPPGAVTDTLALGHRNRKLGSKARPH